METACSEVLEKENIPLSKGPIWNLGGGYGKVGGKFYQVQNEGIQMDYIQPSYSTFNLNGKGKTLYCSFGTDIPMQAEIYRHKW